MENQRRENVKIRNQRRTNGKMGNVKTGSIVIERGGETGKE